MNRPRIILIPVLLCLWLATAAAAMALSEEALDAQVRDIGNGLRCPTCQGISVNDSEAAFSRQIRDKVRRMLQEGQNEEQIKAYFVSRYGEWILRAPKKEGLGLVLWILPGLLIFLAGVWIVVNIQRRGAARRGGAGASTHPLSKADQERVARDLRRFEEED